MSDLMNAKIRFKRTVRFTGRNGTFKAVGLDIFIDKDNVVSLYPITSKGVIGNCRIDIPLEEFGTQNADIWGKIQAAKLR
jgi:hypothetical protein